MRNIAALLLALSLLGGCGFLQLKPLSDQQAIQAVLKVDHNATLFAAFPKQAGQQQCNLSGGLGVSIPAICATSLATQGSHRIVTFTEQWDAWRFHANNDPAEGVLTHTWQFTVNWQGNILQQQEFGNFPPQELTP